jgi:6-phosphogluconolactonase
MFDVIVSKDEQELSIKAFDYFIQIHYKIFGSEHFYIIPGGKTPRIFYSLLAQKVNNWSNTKFMLSDERLVSKESKHSNYKMIKNDLIDKIKLDQKPSIINYSFGDKSKEETSCILENNITQYSNPALAILGLGDDGHTASLFPGFPKIFNETTRAFINVKNRNEPFTRVSLTFPMLMKSNEIMFLISGQKKAHALKMCLEGNYNPINYPAQYLFKNFTNNITLFCDENAASQLGVLI